MLHARGASSLKMPLLCCGDLGSNYFGILSAHEKTWKRSSIPITQLDWQYSAHRMVWHNDKDGYKFLLRYISYRVIPIKRCHMSPRYPIDTVFQSKTPIYAANRERYWTTNYPSHCFFAPSNLGMGRSCPQEKMIHFSNPDAEGAFWHCHIWFLELGKSVVKFQPYQP